MAGIIPIIEKYTNYINQSVNTRLAIADRVKKLVDEQAVMKFGEELAQKFQNVTDESELINLTFGTVQEAYKKGLEEAVPIVFKYSDMGKLKLGIDTKKRFEEIAFKSLNPEEYKIVNGELIQVKDILRNFQDMKKEDLLYFIEKLPSPAIKEGVSYKDMIKNVEFYDKESGKMLKVENYKIEGNAKEGYYYVKGNEKISLSFSEKNYLHEQQMASESFQLNVERLRLDSLKQKTDLTLTQLSVFESKLKKRENEIYEIIANVEMEEFLQNSDEAQQMEKKRTTEPTNYEIWYRTKKQMFYESAKKFGIESFKHDQRLPADKKKEIDNILSDRNAFEETQDLILNYSFKGEHDFVKNYRAYKDEFIKEINSADPNDVTMSSQAELYKTAQKIGNYSAVIDLVYNYYKNRGKSKSKGKK